MNIIKQFFTKNKKLPYINSGDTNVFVPKEFVSTYLREKFLLFFEYSKMTNKLKYDMFQFQFGKYNPQYHNLSKEEYDIDGLKQCMHIFCNDNHIGTIYHIYSLKRNRCEIFCANHEYYSKFNLLISKLENHSIQQIDFEIRKHKNLLLCFTH